MTGMPGVRAALGSPRVHWRVTDSTNERARALALAGAPHGTVVTADRQTAGRGRHGRDWIAPPGSAVLMSLVLRDLDERHALLPLAAAVAVCEACEAVAPVACRIKWPNDVWIERRKVAGILVEARPEIPEFVRQGSRANWAVLGIGLNVTTDPFPEELRAIATSLRQATSGAAPDPGRMLDALLGSLEERLDDAPGAVLEAWRERDALRGGRIRWSGGEGQAAGIDDAGALLVDTAGGRKSLDAGEVHLIRD
jgi:BirA family biotin operon repressor/biotin-[acetyl-CoA-carboxylase] ligase